MGQNRKKLPCPKIRIMATPRSSWGQRGPIGSKKWVKTVKNYHAPKVEFFAKNQSYGYGAKSRWGPPGVHFGANGVPLGPKNGSKP